jgi:hypothetical protein
MGIIGIAVVGEASEMENKLDTNKGLCGCDCGRGFLAAVVVGEVEEEEGEWALRIKERGWENPWRDLVLNDLRREDVVCSLESSAAAAASTDEEEALPVDARLSRPSTAAGARREIRSGI